MKMVNSIKYLHYHKISLYNNFSDIVGKFRAIDFVAQTVLISTFF